MNGDAFFDNTFKEAENGNGSVQLFLGFMSANGEGVPKDLVEAPVWSNLARAKGDENGKKNLPRIESKMSKDQIAEAMKLTRERFERLSK
jgi:uncharacterized protein